MDDKKKLKYEKPSTIDIGRVPSIFGLYCSLGSGADEGCEVGNDPAMIEYCPTGNVATANCWTQGNTAGQLCSTGSTAGLACAIGSTP